MLVLSKFNFYCYFIVSQNVLYKGPKQMSPFYRIIKKFNLYMCNQILRASELDGLLGTAPRNVREKFEFAFNKAQ